MKLGRPFLLSGQPIWVFYLNFMTDFLVVAVFDWKVSRPGTPALFVTAGLRDEVYCRGGRTNSLSLCGAATL